MLAFLADEEAGGKWGARFLVDKHPDLFEGVTEAIGEVGGFSATIGGRRLYLIQTAEKGMAWLRLTARGTAGHGSMIQHDNAVTARRGGGRAASAGTSGPRGRPRRPTRSCAAACAALGIEFNPDDLASVVAKLGPLAKMVGATVSHTLNPTMLSAGYKVNVIPQAATAQVDGRFLPGYEEDFFERGRRAAGAGRDPGVRAP